MDNGSVEKTYNIWTNTLENKAEANQLFCTPTIVYKIKIIYEHVAFTTKNSAHITRVQNSVKWYNINFTRNYTLFILHGNIDQTLMNSLHHLLNCEIDELDCRVITTVYISCPLYTHVTSILQCIGPCNLFRSFRSIFVYNS